MRILWVTNTAIAQVAALAGLRLSVNEGWLSGLCDTFLSMRTDIELHILFPIGEESAPIEGSKDNLYYYSYCKDEQLDKNLGKQTEHFSDILQRVSPDVIHIMGSEYAHSYAMVMACEQNLMLDRAVLSIQGLTSVYAQHYLDGIPFQNLKEITLRDILKKNTLFDQQENLRKRGLYERKTIAKLKHIIGRTEWDFACAKQINKDIRYHFNNENLRGSFYRYTWSYENCIKHSVFMSQATTPIKGFHYALQAMTIVRKKYPDAELYVGSNVNYFERKELPRQMKSAYKNYILDLIDAHDLENAVHFCGAMQEQAMVERFLSSNVFISPSTIENSCNSVGEAMLLGVPVVSSDVGGIRNLLEHGKEGYIYPINEPYMLAHYIMKVFEAENPENMGVQAQMHARNTHNREKNAKDLFAIYGEIAALPKG